eukprot:PhM_4_TR10753/c0_g1_i1/m.56609/K00411/UQCRFS1, RIP1, petA; ubiquinol-cytochrome c reductase iron-sulfur subunit
MLRRTLGRRMDILLRQIELRTPLTKNDKNVTCFTDEFMRPPVSQQMAAKYGQYAKYSTAENAQIADLAQREELILNTYPEGDPKGLIYNQIGADNADKFYASYDEEFFRKHLLKPEKDADEDKARVLDYTLNSAMLGLAFLMTRYFVAPLWWIGQPKATLVAESNIECDIGVLDEKDYKTIVWRGKPIYVYRRSDFQVKTMEETPMSALKHPETDAERFKERREMAIVIAICTHLGCVPSANEGMYGGFFCPCHGSHYDISGRIRQGPAPLNLEVPPYRWIDDETLYLGT